MVFSQLEQGLNLMQEIYLIMPYKRIVLASKDDFFLRCLTDIDDENTGF